MSNVTAFTGVDVGSLGTKTVILVDGKIAGYSILRTGINTEENGQNGLSSALENAGL